MDRLAVQTAFCGKCAVMFYVKTVREWHETGMALDPAQTGKAADYGNGKSVG